MSPPKSSGLHTCSLRETYFRHSLFLLVRLLICGFCDSVCSCNVNVETDKLC